MDSGCLLARMGGLRRPCELRRFAATPTQKREQQTATLAQRRPCFVFQDAK